MTGTRVAIIGAGISGLTAAEQLRQNGYSVVVFDKARGPGGRLCTRRSQSGGFDHGAPYFEADSSLVKRWLDHGVLASWNGRFGQVVSDGSIRRLPSSQRWVGTPKMSAIGRWMARDLDVRLSTRIERLERQAGAWILGDSNEQNHGPFDWVVVSCPGPQAASLIPQDSHLHRVARAMTYSVCWTAMLEFDNRLEVEWDGLQFDSHPIAQAFRSQSKPGRSGQERWVVHAQDQWSADHRDEAPETVGHDLEQAFRVIVRHRASSISVHRWLYAQSTQEAQHLALIDAQLELGLCGDGLTTGGVMQAVATGDYVAQLVIESA